MRPQTGTLYTGLPMPKIDRTEKCAHGFTDYCSPCDGVIPLWKLVDAQAERIAALEATHAPVKCDVDEDNRETCNPFGAVCGLSFCTYEGMVDHNRKHEELPPLQSIPEGQ